MANSKPVQSNEVIVPGVYDPTIKDGKELRKELGKINAGFKNILKTSKQVLGSTKNASTAKQIKAVLAEIDKSIKARKGLIIVLREQAKLEQQLQKAESEKIKTEQQSEALTRQKIKTEREAQALSASKAKALIVERKEQERLIKVSEREAAVLAKNNKRRTEAIGSLNRQRATLIAARKRWDALSKSERDNAAIGGRLSKVIVGLDSNVKKLEKSTGRAQRNVGNYGGAFSKAGVKLRAFGIKTEKLGATLRSGLGLLGITSLVFGFTRAIGDAFRRIREFDKELQNMAGISGSTRKELADVEATIREVAGSSIKTSNEVAKLATTLFTLGKTREEVILMLKPVNDLSIALGTTSEEAADFLGQTLNAFGKGAESSQEFADIIANVRASTSLDFQRIKDALGFVAPTANALGLSLGEISAQVGVLQDNGIKAARAGRLLNSSFARLIDKGFTLDGALAKINASQDKIKTSSELFGKEAFTLGIILAENTEKTARLADEFDNLSEGSLKKLTDEQLKSLDAQLKILDSTWEDFILSIENGEGVISKSIKSTISVFVDLLKAMKSVNEFGEVVQKKTSENIDRLTKTKLVPLLERIEELKKSGEDVLEIRTILTRSLTKAEDELSKAIERGIIRNSGLFQSLQASVNARKQAILSVEKSKKVVEEETVAVDDNSDAITRNNRLRDLTTQNIEDQKLREVKAIQDRFDDEVAKTTTTHEILVQLQIKLWNDLDAVDEKFRAKKESDDKKEAQKRFDEDLKRVKKEGDALNKVNAAIAKKEAEARQEAFDQGSAILDATQFALDKKAQSEQNAIDLRIDRNRDEIARQENLARDGADNELAFQQAQQDKLALQRKESLEKEAREREILQLTEAYFNALNAELSRPDANPDTAPVKALSTVLLAKGIAKGLTGFYDGTEDTGNTGALSDEHGAITGYTHSNERVMTAADNKKIGDMSNSTLTQLAVDSQNGMLLSKRMFDDAGSGMVVATQKNSAQNPLVPMYGRMLELMKENNQRPVQHVDVDSLNRLMETIDRNGRKEVIKYMRNTKRLR